MTQQFDAIQPRDRTDTSTAVENLLKERFEQRAFRDDLEVEAHVRTLLAEAENALVGEGDIPPEQLLERAHAYLWADPN